MDLKQIEEVAKNMAEPTTTTGGALLINKIITILLPIGASVLAFCLSLRFVPVRENHVKEDMINRIICSLLSSIILGVTVLVLLYHHAPGLFASANNLAEAAFLPYPTGFFVLTACVLIVCAIPGPWIVAGVYLWLEKRKGKDIGEIFNDLRKDVKGERAKTHNPNSGRYDADYEQDVSWKPPTPFPEQHNPYNSSERIDLDDRANH